MYNIFFKVKLATSMNNRNVCVVNIFVYLVKMGNINKCFLNSNSPKLQHDLNINDV